MQIAEVLDWYSNITLDRVLDGEGVSCLYSTVIWAGFHHFFLKS